MGQWKLMAFRWSPLSTLFPVYIRERERERMWKEGERRRNGNEVRKMAHVLSIMWWFERLAFFFFFRLLFPITVFFFFFPLDDISLFISFILFIVRQSSGGQKFNIASIKLLIPVVSFKKKKKENHLKILFLPFFRHSLFRRLSARSLPSAGNRSKFPFDAYRLDPTFMNGQIDRHERQPIGPSFRLYKST